jgi:endo-1,4-beta-xylanase
MRSPVRPISPQIFALVVGFGVVACSAGDDAPTSSGGPDETGGASGASGGSISTGGAGPVGGSGGTATGGKGSGGSTSGGSGGTATGGEGLGGSTSGGSGGSATGGTGGKACTNVRPTGTEWDEATCDQWALETEECGNAWMINGNYCNESCGRCSSGTGGTSTGGTSGTGTGGTAPVDIPNTCTEPQGEVCNNLSGRHCGYTYEYWKDQGSGCLTNESNGFSVEWTNVGNLLGRKGLRPGSRNNLVTYQADYQPNGSSYLCVYGWTRSPLVEYYIVDSWGTWRPPGEEPIGTVTSDGGTYELYRTQRVDQPSIEGTRTFDQYWSVRTEKRTSGTITVANHFAAWEGVGLTIGSLYEVSMTVEGYQSSGTADVAMVIR